MAVQKFDKQNPKVESNFKHISITCNHGDSCNHRDDFMSIICIQ